MICPFCNRETAFCGEYHGEGDATTWHVPTVELVALRQRAERAEQSLARQEATARYAHVTALQADLRHGALHARDLSGVIESGNLYISSKVPSPLSGDAPRLLECAYGTVAACLDVAALLGITDIEEI